MKLPVSTASLMLAATGVVCMAAGIYAGLTRLQPAAPENAASTALFRQTLPDLQGQSQNLAQWKGRTLLVNFWAPWCAPCVEEMPELSALQMELKGKNIQIIGIGIDSAENIGQFAIKHRISYPLYVAGSAGTDLVRAFGNRTGGLPFTLLVGADGAVKKTYLGRLKMTEVRRDLAAP